MIVGRQLSALILRLLVTSGLPLMVPPLVLAFWGRQHADAVVLAMGLCGWLALWTMGAHLPLLRALLLAPPGRQRRQVMISGWQMAWIQSTLILLCAVVWQLWNYTGHFHAAATSPLAQGWLWCMAAIWATFPLANAALAHWYAMERFIAGNAWVLLQRMGVLLAIPLASPVAQSLGWASAAVLLAMMPWLLAAVWLLPLSRLRRPLLLMPPASGSLSSDAPCVRTLWRENTHYLLWAILMACYGPLPLVWAAAQDSQAVLLLGTAISVSNMLSLYLGAVCVPWMVDVQKHLNDVEYVQRHRRFVFWHVARALAVALVICWVVLPWYGIWLVGPQQANLLVLYATALLVGQAARQLSLATTQCAAAMKQERLLHPAAIVEVLMVLSLMFLWSDRPEAIGFVAALCAGFCVRGLMALTVEARLVHGQWVSAALSGAPRMKAIG